MARNHTGICCEVGADDIGYYGWVGGVDGRYGRYLSSREIQQWAVLTAVS